MFNELEKINQRPAPFSVCTTRELWTEPYVARQMLQYHLNKELALASRTPDVIEKTVAWLSVRFAIDSETCIADFGCGPGLYTSRLAQRGADVTGIDFSANSIGYARQQAEQQELAINYIEQDYLSFKSDKRFDLICMIMCDFCALGPEQRQQLLGIFHRHLDDGGAVFLDAYSLAGYAARQEQASYELNQLHGFWSANDYYAFVNTFKYDEEKVVLDKYSIFEESRNRTIYNWLQYFSLETLKAEFDQSGFEIIETYADTTGAPLSDDSTEIALVAIKK